MEIIENRGQIVLMKKGEVLSNEVAFCSAGANHEVARLTDEGNVLLKDVVLLLEKPSKTKESKILQIRELEDNELPQVSKCEIISTPLSQRCKELKIPYINLAYGYLPIVFTNEVCWIDPIAIFGQRFYVMNLETAEKLKAEAEV